MVGSFVHHGRPAKVHIAQVRISDPVADLRQTRPLYLGVLQLRPARVCTAQVDAAQVRLAWVALGHVNPTQVALAKVGLA